MLEIKFQIERMVNKIKRWIKKVKLNLFTKSLSYKDKVKVIDYALERCNDENELVLSLCWFLSDGLRKYNLVQTGPKVKLSHKKLFPKFKRENFENTEDSMFWWNPNDIESRIKALNKLKELEK